MAGEVPVIVDRSGHPEPTRAASSRWWKEPLIHMGPAMVAHAKSIEDSPSERGRRAASLVFAQMHSGRPLSSIYDYGSAFRMPYVTGPASMGWRVPINVVLAVIEAIASKMAKNKPRGLVQTIGGDWTLQTRAKGLNKYLDGLHRTNQLYKKGRRVFRDAGAFGDGIFWLEENRAKGIVDIDRTLPIEVIVDDIEAARGAPTTKYRKRPVYRGVLLDMVGDDPVKRKLIEEAKGYNPAGPDGRASEMLPTYEGLHLNGARCIAIEECTILSEQWEYDWFPDCQFSWRGQPDSGIWGQGAAENLLGIQREILQLLGRVSSNMKLAAKLWVFRQPGSGITKAQFSNESVTIMDAESAPTFATPPVMPEQAFRHLWDLYAKAFEAEGVSQSMATGTKPTGLDSAPAQREYNDLQTERFVLMGQDWEELHVEVVEKEVKLSKRMLKAGTKIVVRAPMTKQIEAVEFEKVDIDEDKASFGTFPTSSLPTTPAARMQTIKEWYESGLIPDRETALQLMDVPDLEAALSLELAAIDDIKRILENIIEKGKYEPPEPYMNLALALRMTQSAYLRARGDGVPEKRKDMLLKFIDEVRDTMAEMEPPPAPAAPPVQPGVMPAPPPMIPPGATSPVLPPTPAQMALPQGMDSAALPSQLPA